MFNFHTQFFFFHLIPLSIFTQLFEILLQYQTHSTTNNFYRRIPNINAVAQNLGIKLCAILCLISSTEFLLRHTTSPIFAHLMEILIQCQKPSTTNNFYRRVPNIAAVASHLNIKLCAILCSKLQFPHSFFFFYVSSHHQFLS